MKLVWSLLAASSLIIISCSKKDNSPGKTPTSMTTEEDLLKDSVYLYTKEVYFWQDLIPGYDQFNPRQYTGSTELESAQAVM